jgi:ubiquitin C-terminal hydrolase
VNFDEYFDIEEESTGRRVQYILVAIIHHLGSLNRGHYYANVKINGQWYEMDDDRVS